VDVAIASLTRLQPRRREDRPVERIACASPSYWARRRAPRVPSDLAAHDCIAFSAVIATDTWTSGRRRKGASEEVKVRRRLVVTSSEAAIASALEGME